MSGVYRVLQWLSFGVIAPLAFVGAWASRRKSAAVLMIGFVLSYLVMGTLFFLLITPVGLVLRLLVRDPMERRMLPEAESYWVEARS